MIGGDEIISPAASAYIFLRCSAAFILSKSNSLADNDGTHGLQIKTHHHLCFSKSNITF